MQMQRQAESTKIEWLAMSPFIAIHLAVFGAIWSGVTWSAVICCALLYVVRMFGVTGVYHRYFSHRTYKTSRFTQFLLAFLAQTSAQRGVLWWAAHHRDHHKYSDTDKDIHSPVVRSVLFSHVGWIYANNSDTKYDRIRDFTKFRELMWLDRFWLVPPTILGVTVLLTLGWSGFFIGFCLSTVLVWHGTFTINSLSHIYGSRRYKTTDESRNNVWLALITMGEGWHNNHHHYMHSTRQGFFWWEVDVTYYILRVMQGLHLIHGIKEPPAWAIKGLASAREDVAPVTASSAPLSLTQA